MPPRKRQKKSEKESSQPPKQGRIGDVPYKIDDKVKKPLEAAFGIPFPDDLFQLWRLCCELNKKEPLQSLSILGWKMVGPFEVLAKKIEVERLKTPIKLHLHWRFYFDPPEFMTVIISDDVNDNPAHVGCIRDDPCNAKCVVASNSGKDCKLDILGDNLFAAVHSKIKEKLLTAKGKKKLNLQSLSKKVEEYAKVNNFDLEQQSTLVKARNHTVVAKTFHGAGIVVPIDENEVGYRPLHETDKKLKKMFAKIHEAPNDDLRMVAFDEVQEMITYIQFANDECDFGMGLELGMDMFCHGSRFLNKASNRLLTAAYGLLKRELYAKIMEHHTADRRDKDFSRLPDY